MSIMKLPQDSTTISPKEGEAFFKFDNGDLQAVKNVLEQYGFIDEQAMFRFALFVLLETENNNVYIEQGGLKKLVNPNPLTLRKEVPPNPEAPVA